MGPVDELREQQLEILRRLSVVGRELNLRALPNLQVTYTLTASGFGILQEPSLAAKELHSSFKLLPHCLTVPPIICPSAGTDAIDLISAGAHPAVLCCSIELMTDPALRTSLAFHRSLPLRSRRSYQRCFWTKASSVSGSRRWQVIIMSGHSRPASSVWELQAYSSYVKASFWRTPSTRLSARSVLVSVIQSISWYLYRYANVSLHS